MLEDSADWVLTLRQERHGRRKADGVRTLQIAALVFRGILVSPIGAGLAAGVLLALRRSRNVGMPLVVLGLAGQLTMPGSVRSVACRRLGGAGAGKQLE